MTELALLNTAYPDNNPWFDLRPYLVNGWLSLGSQTCGVAAQPNLLIWSMRLIADKSTSWIFMDGIPGNLRTPQNLPIAIFTPSGASYCLAYRSNGRMLIDAGGLAVLGNWDRKGEMTVTGVTPRGTPT